jgi:FkbM family methyltransferase
MLTLLRRLRALGRRFLTELRLELLRHRLQAVGPGALVRTGGVTLRVTDGMNAYMQYKDEVVRRIYEFDTDLREPLVIDGGANMGAFTIATRRRYPGARIVAFEPDPAIAVILRENLDRNGARDVRIVDAALGGAAGTASFTPDGQAGGALGAAGTTTVRVETLSAYLGDEVAFVKLNIEGAELDVLREVAAAGRLRNIRALVLEYHGWPRAPQRLHDVLAVLDTNGFRYLVHDFDDQTNPATKPPFRDPGDSPWFALVYAERVGVAGGRPA